MKQTIEGLFDEVTQKYNDKVLCIERQQFRRFQWTYQDVKFASDQIASLLLNLNIKKGDLVGLCAANGPLWISTFFACARTGVILVPIDVNSSEEYIRKLVEKNNIELLIKTIYRPLEVGCKTIEIEQLPKLTADITVDYELLKNQKVEPDDTLEIVFTSGSTGDPKGVVLTNRNLVSNLQSLNKAWPVDSKHMLLSMIPLSHMFEQTVGFLTPFLVGSKIVYVQSVRPHQIAQALREERITTIVTVPAFLKLLRDRIFEKLDKVRSAGYISAAMKAADYLPYPIRRYMFQGLYSQLGDSLKLVIVGGSALQPKLEAFWEQMGVHIIQGYGLTETSPIATYSSLRTKKRGSVGKCLPDQKLKLGEGNEILLGGNNVFRQYFNKPEETKKVFNGELFKTGDIGRIDKNGYLYITGRKKNMLLSDSGLNIYPEDIESLLAEYDDITDSVLCMLSNNKINVLTAVILTKKDYDDVSNIIKSANSRLASHQTIQNYIIWPQEDFPRTPTRKVKRNEIIEEVSQSFVNTGDGKKHVNRNDVSKVLYIVSGVSGVNPEKINKNSNLVSDLGLDSLKRLELVSKIEEELGAFIDEADINSKTSFKELEELVKSARHNPKTNLINLSIFESYWFSWVRVFLQLPILLLSSTYQKIDKSNNIKTHKEPVIYIANHTSHMDSITMLKILSISERSKLVIAAAEDYFFSSRIKSIFIRLFLPIIPIDRNGNIQTTLQRLGRYLDKGYSILIFPEGTRGSSDEKLGRFLPGIGVIAQELNVPIQPLKFVGNHKILPKGKAFPKSGTTKVTASEIYHASHDRLYDFTAKELEKIVSDL